MANIFKTDSTPAKVAKLATQNSDISRGQTDLIGLFGPQNSLSALVRKPNGAVQRVETGERLTIGRIVAIDKDGLMMERNGRTWRLSLPNG